MRKLQFQQLKLLAGQLFIISVLLWVVISSPGALLYLLVSAYFTLKRAVVQSPLPSHRTLLTVHCFTMLSLHCQPTGPQQPHCFNHTEMLYLSTFLKEARIYVFLTLYMLNEELPLGRLGNLSFIGWNSFPLNEFKVRLLF